MVSHQLIERMLHEIAEITHAYAAIYEKDGTLVASVGDFSGITPRDITSFVSTGSTRGLRERVNLSRISQSGDVAYVSAVRSDSEHADMAERLISCQLVNLLDAAREEMDKESFIKNLILDNLLQIDIFNRSRTLGIRYEEPRVVYLVHARNVEQRFLHEELLKICEGYLGDFVVGTDESKQIIVHSLDGAADRESEPQSFADRVSQTIGGAGTDVIVAYGGVIGELKDVSKSYKEARLAYDVRSIFYEDKKIISYNALGIGRLIYQLPLRLCSMYINETFNGREIDELEDEMLSTANKFFENNLNVSETSRQLFIHRNTLVYRLDKIQKLMGLDLRVFDDAITFKIALMVGKYLNYMERSDF